MNRSSQVTGGGPHEAAERERRLLAREEAPATAGVSRRTFLRRAGAGAGAVVVGAGGVGYRVYDNGVFSTGDGTAYDAWREWERGEGPAALVAAAVLAPNPHNSQAWAFRVSDDQIDLFADRNRPTGALDPFGRELQVGLGAALENLLLAAPAHGYGARLRLQPTAGEPVHAARVELSGGPRQAGALYRAIPHRHTDRSRYDGRPVPAADLAAMSALADGLPHARVRWFSAPAQLRRIGALMVSAAAAVTRIVTVPDARDDAQRMTGGRLLQRIHLWTAANGLSLQHMNQITERADRERQLDLAPRFGDAIQALVPAGTEPLAAFRIGYPRNDDGRRLSPRRPAAEVIA
ncbi:twin-arginine translocation signal domain-containing protein [Conexibacter sp. CPCC 206217]|uniref:twin-arginine translocation signal domain-containing protein n=1 Tax=Conexibacter sp. CPCC 206217 TaxID=3064574 RepID=UPI002718AE27|nr:twin-arginine translocation signal domain-containing protein [Conexibacter sp. CPCC 206217]MDO8213563.1 twin-arginine translocation signal domain-containing protein [Conexibacter sp. CPCC 206217]